MRVLGVTETCDLGSLYLRLIEAGHDVRVSVNEPLAAGTMSGLVPRSANWRKELEWVRAAGADGLILFEAVGFGELQDDLRSRGFNVIGGSALGDRLENDRGFALQLLANHGLCVAPVAEFTRIDQALADLASRPRRCVFKLSASAGETFVGAFEDGRDVAALLNSRAGGATEPFILMDFVSGVETGVGAYFNGDHFLRPACLDWEHKRFFAGDMGELTGEMGTVATFEGSDAIFEATLAPLEPVLRQAGHVGYINLNTIINADGVWPLEFTCRFGYPGFAVLEPLQVPRWDELFAAMIGRSARSFEVRPGFSLCVVLTTPPFPYSRHEVEARVGFPVLVDDVPREHLHWGEVGRQGSDIVTSGVYGWTAVVTGTGETVSQAKSAAYENAQKVQAPNLRYRLDIGDKLISAEFHKLTEWGWLKSMPPSRIASQIVR
jgi:phosphoribosylamine--glycine ligase